MSKRGKVGVDAKRWVAKRPAGDAGYSDGKTPGQTVAFAPEPDISLEDFKSEWREVPEGSDASNTDYYFNSYTHFGIHEDMLKDAQRTGCYMKSIVDNKHLFKDKVVLDVGAGTGILSLFAAKAGAKKCIGIECSDIVHFARSIAEKNGYGNTITYVHGKCEEVTLPVDEVDIIVSEWMGYFLIYESMLDSVLYARDKWLKKDGLMFPDHARLYMAAIEDADYKEEKIGFWGHLWGFDFSPMQQSVLQEPISDIVHQEAIATNVCPLLDVDLRYCKKEDLDFFAEYKLRVLRKDFLHALVVWFDVSFEACSPPVILSTAPRQPFTHWKQTVLYLDEVVPTNAGEELSGMIAVRKNAQNPRDLDVKLSYELKGQYGSSARTQYYRVR